VAQATKEHIHAMVCYSLHLINKSNFTFVHSLIQIGIKHTLHINDEKGSHQSFLFSSGGG
jgi:hypothetical protein